MKYDCNNYIKAKGQTKTALAKIIFCGRQNMKAKFLRTGGIGEFWIMFGKKSEIEIPKHYRKTDEFISRWFEIYDDERMIFQKYYNLRKTKKTEIYQFKWWILLIEVDE